MTISEKFVRKTDGSIVFQACKDSNDYAGKSAAIAAATPAQEVEPVGCIHRIELSVRVSVGVNLTATGEMLRDGTNLYTHPANDGLRKAAQEAIRVYEDRTGPDYAAFQRAMNGLRCYVASKFGEEVDE